MRQEQPKTARLRHGGPTKGGQKPKISSTLLPKRQFDYISAEPRGHLGNVVSMAVPSLRRRYGRDIMVVAALAALTISPAVGAGHCVPVRYW